MTEMQLADNLFSKFIRARAGWQCERCSKWFPENSPFLDCAHFVRRGHKATRLDPNNCIALCRSCHQLFDSSSGRPEFEKFMLKWHGKAGYDALIKKGESSAKESEVVAEALKWLRG